MKRILAFTMLLALFVSPSLWDVALGATPASANDDEWERVLDLRGIWRFQLGDDLDWADPDLNDMRWGELFVPARWEDEGYPGYDGFAWYRRHFKIHPDHQGKPLFLHMGRIDDVDEVYLNGHLIGSSGNMPPRSKTAYHVWRVYRIPTEFLNFSGDNVIAVRVYDDRIEGGILEGQVGIYESLRHPRMFVDLSGRWLFQRGDNPEWREETVDKKGWESIAVPAKWEAQGYRRYDGYAWYRKQFYLPEIFEDEELILLLGKIDDLDETFFNGQMIGRTGDLDSRRIRGDEWQVVRAYPVPSELVRYGDYNTIAVNVYDGLGEGGIFEGPIGIVPRREYDKLYGDRKWSVQKLWDLLTHEED